MPASLCHAGRLAAAFGSLALIALSAAPCTAQGAPRSPARDTVFIVPGSHLDIGFTAPISMVREQRIGVLDQAIKNAERDPAFVWFEEGGWTVEAWLDRYQGQVSKIAALRRLVTSGRIGVGATLLGPHGAAFPRALGLLTTHLDRVQRELGVRPTVAVINDVPALPEAMVDALAAAGIRYLLVAPNLNFSPPLPVFLVKQPFYWESSKGARVLVYLDADGYNTASLNWGIPPECATAMNSRKFPQSLGPDSIVARGVRDGLLHRVSDLPLLMVQDAFDNWDTECAQLLPATLKHWNAQRGATRLVVATPEKYFQHLERRFGSTLPVRRGEWGGDWDLLRATEPVWSWRLREAMSKVTAATSPETKLALATAMDHNVGLGTRWLDGLSRDIAMRHVREVAALYRSAVTGVLGEKGATSVPAPLPRPVSSDWPKEWLAIAGEAPAARIRVGGPGFLHPMIDDGAAIVAVPMGVTADVNRMLVHVQLDRAQLEAIQGPRRFGAVIEIRMNFRPDQLKLAPENSPAAIAGRWLLGKPPESVIAPDGVRVTGPGLSLRARGPLIIGWSLARDPRNPGVTWLQGLAFIDALEGMTDVGAFRRPFAELYPGEPATVDYEIEVVRLKSGS